MKHGIFKYIIVLFFFLFSGQLLYAQVDASSLNLSKYVKDETGTLTQDQINSLLKKLVDFDKQTTNQVIVCMISSLNGETIEDVSLKIAELNKIGKKDRNNGVLFLIAKNDRKLRIEVGYGLEGALPDATTNSIIRNDVTPLFKQGKFFEGIDKGVDAIISATKGEYKAEKNNSNNISSPVTCCFGAPLFIVLIFGFIFFSIFMSIIRRFMGFGTNMYSGRRGSNWTNHGGWFGGGSSGSSGSSFGGFTGGGGSFGGGGSSGNW